MPAGLRTWQRAFPQEALWVLGNPRAGITNTTPARAHAIQVSIQNSSSAFPEEPARAWEAWEVPNGEYTIVLPGDLHFYYRVHTVQSGELAGKRIIKRREGPSGLFKGFAFITREAGFSLWRSHASSIDADWVRIAREFFSGLGPNFVSHADPRERGWMFLGLSGTVVFTSRCRLCNTFLFGVEEDAQVHHAHFAPVAARREPTPEFVRDAGVGVEVLSTPRSRLPNLPLCQNGTGQIQ